VASLSSSTADRLEAAVEIAEAAGAVLATYHGRRDLAEKKGEVDLVTEADRRAEALIVERLHARFPRDAYLAEEGAEHGLLEAGFAWIIDPLDGTTNFVHASEHFAVSIGIAYRGELVAGVVHAPILGRTYRGRVGDGAWSAGERLRVSPVAELGLALVGTGFPYDRRSRADELLAPLRRAIQTTHGVRRKGAASLDLVEVARGTLDGFWETGLAPWDMAAGVVLVREAGGLVTAYGGRPFDVGQRTILASNGLVHEELVRLVDGG
jgi:myo-inositol-1(or 4)-monophosphatase